MALAKAKFLADIRKAKDKEALESFLAELESSPFTKADVEDLCSDLAADAEALAKLAAFGYSHDIVKSILKERLESGDLYH